MQRARDPRSLKMQVEATWILANMCAGKSSQVAVLVEKGVIPLSLELLQRQISVIEEQVIWLVGNIAGDSDIYRQTFVSNGALKEVVRIYLNSHNKEIKKCCGWVISNILRVEKPVD